MRTSPLRNPGIRTGLAVALLAFGTNGIAGFSSSSARFLPGGQESDFGSSLILWALLGGLLWTATLFVTGLLLVPSTVARRLVCAGLAVGSFFLGWLFALSGPNSIVINALTMLIVLACVAVGALVALQVNGIGWVWLLLLLAPVAFSAIVQVGVGLQGPVLMLSQATGAAAVTVTVILAWHTTPNRAVAVTDQVSFPA
jgi:hypothetical protein